MDISRIVEKIVKLDTKRKVKFIVLFGSVVRGEQTPLSDVDVAVYYGGTADERFNFRRCCLGSFPDQIDVQIFQDLPLAVRNEVIKGKVVYSRGFQFVFDEFMKVIKEFRSFEKYYTRALEELQQEMGVA